MTARALALATRRGRDRGNYGLRATTTKLLAELLEHLASLLLRDKLELHVAAAATDWRRVTS